MACRRRTAWIGTSASRRSERDGGAGSGDEAGEGSDPKAEAFRAFTVERYNASILRLARLKYWYAGVMATTVVVAGLLFVSTRSPPTALGSHFQWLTVAWLLPVPILLLTSALFFGWFGIRRFRIDPSSTATIGPKPRVIFQVTSTGESVATNLHTVRSALYWTRRHPEVSYDPEVWLVVEEWGYLPNQAELDVLRREGARIVVTPMDYQTAKGTTRKGRALQYATECRAKLGLPLEDLWVYHQDDETAVGEDTVLGIDEFVRAHRGEKAVGCGIILYPQHAEDLRPSQIQEFGRTKDDIRTLYTITSQFNAFSGFHGSHYIARADVEEETGWDVGPDMTSEDLIFETRVREQHGAIFHLLKGFAYEQAAFTIRDQLRQRRRWFQGWWRAVLHLRFPLLRRVVMTYGMIVWMSAIFSVTAMILGWVFGYSAIFAFSGIITGFVWAGMIEGYHQGYVLHLEYLPPRTVPLWRVVLNGVVGALSDAVAPWYGTFTRRPRAFQVIVKDRSPVPRPQVPLPVPRYSAMGK